MEQAHPLVRPGRLNRMNWTYERDQYSPNNPETHCHNELPIQEENHEQSLKRSEWILSRLINKHVIQDNFD